MRTYTSGGITGTFPEQFILSGNRNVVTITGATSNSTFSLFGDKRELYYGEGEFDLAPYINALFADYEKNEKFGFESYTQNLFIDDAPFCSIDLTQIYLGANEFGDKRELPTSGEFTQFSPFFDFWLPTDMEAQINGVDYDFVEGFNSVDLTGYTSDVEIRFSLDGFTSFDDTFDFTFYGETVSIRLKYVECASNGVILRYLNHWGIWQQKTFQKATTLRSSKKETYNWNEQPSRIIHSGLQFSEVSKSLGMDIVSENCPIEEVRRLSELTTSDNVHVYDFENSIWLPVTIGTKDFVIAESKGYQDVKLKLIMQNEY